MPGNDNPPWLTSEQQQIWRASLAGVAHILDHLNNSLGGYGLDLNEYESLVTLSESPNHRLRMSELATGVQQSRSRLTHTAKRMEDQGLLERCRANDDGRGVVAQLTDKGMALLVRAAPDHVRSVREILIDVADPADLRALGRIMGAVAEVAD